MDLKFILKSILMLIIVLIGSFFIYKVPSRVNVDMRNIDFEKYNKLMIVAHPDDEMIWGGSHLINDDYVVVCVTCGRDKERLQEIRSVLRKTKDQFVGLGYPDKTDGKRDDWEDEYSSIKEDLEEIINKYEWKEIVTHNIDGEYGHEHHIMINKMVRELYKENKIDSKLFFFGDYYKKSELPLYVDSLEEIDNLEKKEEILEIYVSQKKVRDNLSHMFKYEMWVEYHGE